MAEIRTPDVDDLLCVLAAIDDPDTIFALLEAGVPSTGPLPENEIPRSVLEPLQRGGSPKPPLLFFEYVYARSTYCRSSKILSACS